MRLFIVIFCVLLCLLYLQYYIRVKPDYQILQVYLDNFKLNTLYEKYPIVVYDQIYNVQDILDTVFKYSFTFKSEYDITPGQIYRNSHKYIVLSCDDDVSVKLIHPKYKKDIKANLDESNLQYITIKLKEHQVLIIPALWYFHTSNMDIKAIGLDDLVTKWLYKLV